jgi:hypothetical protein
MNVAKILKSTGIVENLEVVPNQKWVEENSNGDYMYVEYSLEGKFFPVIGLSWSSEHGFEQPPIPEDYIPVEDLSS